jgi:hypothetical protein
VCSVNPLRREQFFHLCILPLLVAVSIAVSIAASIAAWQKRIPHNIVFAETGTFLSQWRKDICTD